MTKQSWTAESMAADMAVTVRDLEQLPGTIYEKAMAAYEDRAEMAEALREARWHISDREEVRKIEALLSKLEGGQ